MMQPYMRSLFHDVFVIARLVCAAELIAEWMVFDLAFGLFQEIIPDHQESPAGDPLGSSSSIAVDHPSMSDYLEFMKDIPRRSVEGYVLWEGHTIMIFRGTRAYWRLRPQGHISYPHFVWLWIESINCVARVIRDHLHEADIKYSTLGIRLYCLPNIDMYIAFSKCFEGNGIPIILN